MASIKGGEVTLKNGNELSKIKCKICENNPQNIMDDGRSSKQKIPTYITIVT